MSLAGTVQNAAVRALKAYGASGTLTHVTPGAYNTATSATAAGTTTNTTVSALLDAASLHTLGYRFGQDLVQTGDLKATIAGASPAPEDTLTLALGTFTIVAVRPSYVGGTAVMHECLVRK